jgi:hypothetical protein
MIRRLGVVALAVVAGLGVVAGSTAPSGAFVYPTVLRGITCKGPSFCVAVGYSQSSPYRPFIARYDGTHWTKRASPAVSGGGVLADVACISTVNCFAVGLRGTNQRVTLIEHWDGTAWRVMKSPTRSYSALQGVSCVSAKFCVAVGDSFTGTDTTLVEHWNGTSWKIVASPNRTNEGGGPSYNPLRGVSCVSTSFCFAVGTTDVGSLSYTYILGWNGHAWSINTHQNSSGDPERLFDVACPTVKRCLAVGDANNTYPARALKDRWDGRSWHVSDSGLAKGELLFNGVSCVSASACLAIGERNHQDGYAEYFNGSTWKPISTSQIANLETTNVACVQAHNCYAIGENVVAHWNGSSWKIVAYL